MERRELDGLTREELITRAEGLGVPRPRVLTKAELIDEILARTAQSESERARVRGFLGRARDLLSRVVERGLHLPEAARPQRDEPPPPEPPPPPRPLPTTTLAEIYAAQGHVDRAIAVLDEILERAPQDEGALRLRARLLEQASRAQGEHAQEERAAEAGAGAAQGGVEGEAEAGGEPRAVASADEGEHSEAAPAARDGAAAVPAPAGAPAQAAPVAEGGRAGAAVGLAAASLDERAELPARYDVDEIVGLAVDPETLYVYWEVRPRTLARARARRPDGQLVVRVVAVLPSWERPVVAQRDLPIDALFGDMFVRDIPSGANLRMSTGWLAGDSFEPFAVGLEVAVPRALPVAPRPSAEAPAASVPAPPDEGAGSCAVAAQRDTAPRPEGAAGEAPAPASAAIDPSAALAPSPGADDVGAAPAAVAGAASVVAAPAPTTSMAAERGGVALDAVAPAVGSSAAPAASREPEPVEAAVSREPELVEAAASREPEPELVEPAASREPELVEAAVSREPEPVEPAASREPEPVEAAVSREPELVAPAAGIGPSPEVGAATHVAATAAPAPVPPRMEPPRFPSGTVPTPAQIAQAVAATRGGASELGRPGAGGWRSGQFFGSEAMRAPAGPPRPSESSGTLWRSFTGRIRPPSSSR